MKQALPIIKCLTCKQDFKAHSRGYIKRGWSKYCSLLCRPTRRGELAPSWTGDKVGYFGLHNWIKKIFPKPECCMNCRLEKKLDLANISGLYKREITDWTWLCRKCHMLSDGRLNRLAQGERLTLAERGKWSRRYDKCRGCGQTTPKHHAQGYCKPCYRIRLGEGSYL
jgi:hypothetical protein